MCSLSTEYVPALESAWECGVGQRESAGERGRGRRESKRDNERQTDKQTERTKKKKTRLCRARLLVEDVC